MHFTDRDFQLAVQSGGINFVTVFQTENGCFVAGETVTGHNFSIYTARGEKRYWSDVGNAIRWVTSRGVSKVEFMDTTEFVS